MARLDQASGFELEGERASGEGRERRESKFECEECHCYSSVVCAHSLWSCTEDQFSENTPKEGLGGAEDSRLLWRERVSMVAGRCGVQPCCWPQGCRCQSGSHR